MIENTERFSRAMALFDAANAQDPNLDEGQPKELLYAQRMSDMIARFAPDASEASQLAVRAQHIQRWMVPRNTYPMTKEGYHAWRTGLYTFQADSAGELMRQAGYDDAMIERVKKAVGKRGIKSNPDTQMLEDIAGLVFIEHYMLAFALSKPEYDEEKWLEIIRKTWKKMSKAAQAFALSGKIELPEPLVPLITKAVSQ
ncbi:MAG TPA: DUF4202 domain-containing protein [Thiobacillus sp.]|jgi:hypothetical protein|nr:MAG: hypothetical protein B7Y27_07070 [Hydrogenophilales bacterium 16-64-40]OZA34983.1 MAG: hypothetical protein B7X82_03165 [Hydrogenophilales bacterium 17-64-65]HQS80904.1 DUF4202 domain-containing protein [Thiobacillus sp.]HQT33480.1 DUF4202 domain-containing protein [Thiobacillus sp.]